MEITCDKLLESTVINLIKLYDSLSVSGVVGIFTEGSAHYLEGTTIGALGLLTYYNELPPPVILEKKLDIIDVTLPKGKVTHFTLSDTSNGVFHTPYDKSEEGFTHLTEEVKFKLLFGSTTPDNPLVQDDIYEMIEANNLKDYQFTQVPLPLLTKNILKFDIKHEGSKSIITCEGLNKNIWDNIISSINVK